MTSSSSAHPAVVSYWTSEFDRIKFTKSETVRRQSIEACFHAAVRNNLTFNVRDDHPYLGDIQAAFGKRVEVLAGYVFRPVVPASLINAL